MNRVNKIKRTLLVDQSTDLIAVLKKRFETNPHRHKGIEWKHIESKLNEQPEKLWSVHQMEVTGGEPDVILFDKKSGECFFIDCCVESPKERRSLCYDRASLISRKEHKPQNSAIDMAEEMGIEILTEEQYRRMQEFDDFDTKTSSWILTPEAIRKAGGALFCDRRYNHVFTYHNGAESYYAARGFRGLLKL